MEIFLHREDQRFVLRNALDLVSPLASNLDGCLDGFGTCVHGQDHVKAKQFRRILSKAGEDVIVECTAAECQARCLLSQGLDEFRVAVTLVDGAVCREEVEIMFALRIPDAAATRSGKHWTWSAQDTSPGAYEYIPIGRGW